MKSQVQNKKGQNKRILRLVTQQQARRYKNNYEMFNKQYSQDQKLNPLSKFKMHVVSNDFLASWKVLCTSEDSYRLVPVEMNASLYDEMGNIRKDIRQKYEYQLVSFQTFKLLQEFQSNQLRCVDVLSEKQKLKLPAKIYRYVVVGDQNLKQIDQKMKKRNDFTLKQIESCEQSSIKQLIENIMNQQKYDLNYESRLWKVEKSQNLDSMFQQLKVAADRANYQYRIRGFGERLNSQSYLFDLKIEQGQFFIVEVKEKAKRWYMLNQSDKKCEGCDNIQELRFPCECQKVVYCSQECKQKDKRFHVLLCTAQAGKSPNKKQKSDFEGKQIVKKQHNKQQQIKNVEQVAAQKEPSIYLANIVNSSLQKIEGYNFGKAASIKDLQQKNISYLMRINQLEQKLLLCELKNKAVESEQLQKLKQAQGKIEELKQVCETHLQKIRQLNQYKKLKIKQINSLEQLLLRGQEQLQRGQEQLQRGIAQQKQQKQLSNRRLPNYKPSATNCKNSCRAQSVEKRKSAKS